MRITNAANARARQPWEKINAKGSVERCGWERPAWTLRGEATFSLGAAAVELRTLGPDEVNDARFYYPPPLGGDFALMGDVVDCDNLAREDIVSGYAQRCADGHGLDAIARDISYAPAMVASSK